jgi:hypothetical protein
MEELEEFSIQLALAAVMVRHSIKLEETEEFTQKLLVRMVITQLLLLLIMLSRVSRRIVTTPIVLLNLDPPVAVKLKRYLVLMVK